MISPYRHVSFDLDGTLVHTQPEYRYAIVPEVLEELGGTGDREAIDAFWFGSNRHETIHKRFGLEPERFWEAFRLRDTVDRRDPYTFAYPDAVSALRKLNGLGKTVTIITGSPKWIADMEIAKLEGVDIAHVLALREGGFKEKPCPDAMRHVLQNVGHDPTETIYIGNGAEDAEFAEAAGCGFALIDRGEHAFTHPRPVRKISTLEELFTDGSSVN